MGGFRGGRRLLRVRGRIRQETRVGEGKDDAIKFRDCGKKWKFDDHWSLAGGFTFPFKSLQRQRLRDLEGPPKPIFTRLSASPQLSRRRIKKPAPSAPESARLNAVSLPRPPSFPAEILLPKSKGRRELKGEANAARLTSAHVRRRRPRRPATSTPAEKPSEEDVARGEGPRLVSSANVANAGNGAEVRAGSLKTDRAKPERFLCDRNY